MIPGNKLIRVPWLNSAYSKPRSRTSRNIARPSVCRCEFQQVENEYIIAIQRPNAVITSTASGHDNSKWILQVRVTRAQHCGEPRGFHLAPFAFAGLLEVPVIAHNLKRPFAVDFFLQSPQGFLYWLAFF